MEIKSCLELAATMSKPMSVNLPHTKRTTPLKAKFLRVVSVATQGGLSIATTIIVILDGDSCGIEDR